MVLVLMSATNIRSIEQLKHVRGREAGVALALLQKIPGGAAVAQSPLF